MNSYRALIRPFLLAVVSSVVMSYFITLIATSVQAAKNQPEIVLGVRTISSPVAGFCKSLKQELEAKGNKVISHEILNQYAGRLYSRYSGLLMGNFDPDKIDAECGPNSLSSGDLLDSKGNVFSEQIKFSNSFYSTNIKLLLRKSLAKSLSELPIADFEERLGKIKIGVMGGTTTWQQFQTNQDRYNLTELNAENGRNALEKALDALESGEIEALASDGMILQSFFAEGVTGGGKTQGAPTYLTQRDPYKSKGFIIFPSQDYPSPDDSPLLPGMRAEKYVIAISKQRPNSDEIYKQVNEILFKPGTKLKNAKESLADFEAETTERKITTSSPIPIPRNEDSTWWVPIIVAIIALAGVVITAVLNPHFIKMVSGFSRKNNDRRKLYGVVLDKDTDEKVKGAFISLEAAGLAKSESTDSQGVFSFYFQCTEDEVRLRANKDGYEPYDVRISIEYYSERPVEIKLDRR
jgi:hypothetical protein